MVNFDSGLFKDSVLSIQSPPTINTNTRLPPLSVAKILRQKRKKMQAKSTLPTSLNNTKLSWNYMYNAPENYSFN